MAQNIAAQKGKKLTLEHKAKIGISFVQPDNYKFGKKQYKIGYTPWESTGIFPSWEEPLRSGIDELWTTSQWCADMFRNHTDKPIFVYEHGIEDEWIPMKRNRNPDRPLDPIGLLKKSIVDKVLNLYEKYYESKNFILDITDNRYDDKNNYFIEKYIKCQ